MAAADDTFSATVGAGGTATVTISTRNRLQTWTVAQVSAEMSTAPIGAVCTLRKDGVFVTYLIATGDVAGGDPPVTLRPGQRLTVEWENCTPGDSGTVYIIYDDGTPE